MKYVSLFIFLFFTACIKESNTFSTTRFNNTTSHYISVDVYKWGGLVPQHSFFLTPGESKIVLSTSNGGIGNGIALGSMLMIMDSIKVVFDDLYRITHYKPSLTGTNPHNYPYHSPRNIFNDSSYTRVLKGDRKYRRECDFKYTFTQQDYLDAR
jgi:hypothetical protein